VNRHLINPRLVRPLSNSLRFSVVGEEMVVPCVVRLLFPVGPAAVLFIVAKAVIDALNSQALRDFANVLKEVLEHVPPLADCYPASAVVGVIRVVRVITAGQHVSPGDVCQGCFAVRFMAVRGVRLFRPLDMKAPAGLRVPSFKLPA